MSRSARPRFFSHQRGKSVLCESVGSEAPITTLIDGEVPSGAAQTPAAAPAMRLDNLLNRWNPSTVETGQTESSSNGEGKFDLSMGRCMGHSTDGPRGSKRRFSRLLAAANEDPLEIARIVRDVVTDEYKRSHRRGGSRRFTLPEHLIAQMLQDQAISSTSADDEPSSGVAVQVAKEFVGSGHGIHVVVRIGDEELLSSEWQMSEEDAQSAMSLANRHFQWHDAVLEKVYGENARLEEVDASSGISPFFDVSTDVSSHAPEAVATAERPVHAFLTHYGPSRGTAVGSAEIGSVSVEMSQLEYEQMMAIMDQFGDEQLKNVEAAARAS